MTPYPAPLHGGEPQPDAPEPDAVDRCEESAAGEEDPGAGLDLGDAAAPPDPREPQTLPDGR